MWKMPILVRRAMVSLAIRRAKESSMIWSNWRKAIWQGAGVAAMFWAGLAWTQSPTPSSSSQGPERIMVVHENGRSLRCRVLQSWQLPDSRIAHLLQAVDSGEMVTIVDEHAP